MIYTRTVLIEADEARFVGLDPGKAKVLSRGRFQGKDVLVVKHLGHASWVGRFAPREWVTPQIQVLTGMFLKKGSVAGTAYGHYSEEFLIDEEVIEWKVQRKQR